jgi:Trypsin-like peptidase domain
MSGWDAVAAGIDPERVAELLVTPAQPGPGRRGSGYRVSASAVLTAAHVVRDADRVWVRFNADRPGEWLTEGTVKWSNSDPMIDAAVVTIAPRPQDKGQVALVGFGRVAERDAVLACSAMGFPRFKLRDDPAQPLDDGSPSQYRDSVHAVGTIAVLSNRREGTLEVSVPAPERDPDPDRSPWEGMSGAAVWCAGRIIGLVAEHHRADGLGRLAATRVDRWYERLPPDRLDELRTLTGLPARLYDLTDVLPPTAGQVLEAGYTAQVRDIAPDALVGREQELAELVQFCAGEERYQWWQAGPWAGKSALAAWFVLHPPAGVSVVSFFVTGRLAGQADSDAFTEAMIEQLAAVAGEPIAALATSAGPDRERRRLLDLAATRVGERGSRLLLVVDGLDEDEGAKPGSGKPSIASLLPKRPPDAVRVLVFSRPSPGIPGDVPGDHPLRRCTPRPLAPSPYAEDVRLEAKQELLEQLHGDQLQVDVIGFITASGGGLTLRELAELTRRPKYLLDGRLGSVFGRSLRTRLASHEPPEHANRVYLFAHETLRTTAEEELAGDLGPYRRRIDAWADDYRAQGWPESTPRYLLRPYGRLLATSGDLQRLVALATDSARHDRMLSYTQGDAAALAEITTTQQLILTLPVPDLAALGRLAVHLDRLADRNRALPWDLPALWARLGQFQRAEAMARSITEPKAQAWALDRVAEALASVGQWDRAEQIARTMTDPNHQAIVLYQVAKTLASVGQWDRAEQTARTITGPFARVWTLHALIEALADVDRDRARTLAEDAEQIARSITDPGDRTEALAAVAQALAAVDRDRALVLAADAEQAARSITNPDAQARALTTVAQALVEAGQQDHAEQLACSITNPYYQARALGVLAEALAEVGQLDHAEQIARSIEDPVHQIEALGAVAKALAEVGQLDRAEQIARTITDPYYQARALGALAKALAEVDRDRALALAADAEQTARSITEPKAQAEALGALAKALAEVDRDRALALAAAAEQTARSITSPASSPWTPGVLAEALAEAGLWDRAEQTARSITSHSVQAWALGAVAEALAEVDRDRALSLAADAEQTARRITDPDDQARALGALAKALAEVDRDRALSLAADAEQLARSIEDPVHQIEALAAVAEALGEVDPHRALSLAAGAEQTARSITDPVDQINSLGAVAKALAEVGQLDRAEQTARGITSHTVQAWALGAVAEALVEVGEWGRAEQIARTITEPNAQAQALGALAKALAEVDRDRALALAADAEQTARRMTPEWERPWALSALAVTLAGTGQRDRSKQTTRSSVKREAQVEGYPTIAPSLKTPSTLELSGRDDFLRVRAFQLVADMLAEGHWAEAIRPLSKLNPLGVLGIYEALCSLNA